MSSNKCESPCPPAKWKIPFSRGDILCPKCMRFEMDWAKSSAKGHPERRIVYGLTSGGFDPIHPGHISCFLDRIPVHIDKLIVVVNGDEFLKRKKGSPFMPLKVRTQIVSCIFGVDYAVPFTPSNLEDMGVGEAIEIIRPDYFLKGGDRTNSRNIPEWDICKSVGTKIITGCGDDKYWSSSDFLRQWEMFAVRRDKKGF